MRWRTWRRCGTRNKLFGSVASDATAWRVLDRVDAEHLTRLHAVRAGARERAWAAGVGPDLSAGLVIDIDATITIAHSEKENAAKTWKKTFGFHPLLAYLDRPDVAGGEALAGILRPGKAGSNTAADHIDILTMALSALPAHARPCPGDPESPQVMVRTDAAGATHAFARAVRDAGCGFSLGFSITTEVQMAVLAIPADAWAPAYDLDGQPRKGAWVADHRHARPDEVADRITGHHPSGTTAPRCAAAVHRHRWAPVHRVHHRHHRRATPRPRSPPPKPRPGRSPHPLRHSNRPAQLPLPRLRREQSLAGTGTDRR